MNVLTKKTMLEWEVLHKNLDCGWADCPLCQQWSEINRKRFFAPSMFFNEKHKRTILRIKEHCPPEGYHLAFSGGKDSICIYFLAKEAGVKFDAHYSFTTVDPPELYYFVRNNFPDVEIKRPVRSMWQLIRERAIPPTSIMRFCCEELKEGGGVGRRLLTGVRWEESARRKKRKMIEPCYKEKTRIYFHAIIDWTIGDVWHYIKTRKLPYCSLYDEGWERLGCIMCPLVRCEQREREARRWYKHYLGYLNTFGRMLETRKNQGKATTWKTKEDVMRWWLYEEKMIDPETGEEEEKLNTEENSGLFT